MPVRQGSIDLGDADATRLRRTVGGELRQARLALGVSQRTVAGAARISASRLGRIERGETRDPSLVAVCRAARVLGMTASVKLYPAGTPVRDAGQLRLAERYRARLRAPLRLRGETALPAHDDDRAWDGMTVGEEGVAFNEYESRLGDVQAMERRVALKLRDDPRSTVVILVVARTRQNVRSLDEHREALRSTFPLDGPAIARELRAGRLPRASGILVL